MASWRRSNGSAMKARYGPTGDAASPCSLRARLRYRHRLTVVIIEEYQAATDDVTSLSRRPHLDLLRRLRPPLEPRVEVALEGLELRAELAGRRGAVGARVERRVLERRHHTRDLGFQR